MPKRIFVLALLGALLLIIKGFALAWVEPTQAPPAGNVPAPLNVGNGYQIKSGVLQIKNPDASSADATEGNWFHIGTYNKTFAQAKAACEAQGARLAYYSEIVDAFKNGANACSYGWISEGFVVYPMQDGATGGCGGSVGGVRVSRPALTATYGAYCARDSFLINGSLANGGNLYAKGLYLNSGQSAGQMYFGLLDNGSNADKLGICFDGDCKTAWDQVVGAPTNATYLTISSDATLTNERIVTAGTGVTITDGGVGGNLTINVNPITVQTRVASAGCVAGSSIRVINQDGSVVCEVDDSGSGGTVGPGIINRIAKFTAASTIGDSIITDNGANVGIGDTTPSSKLDVAAPSTALPTVLLNRVAGQSSIKSSDTNGYLLLDSNGSAAGLNWYSADNVILANGG
ncbi:hypothetical protein COU05_02740, partial [bacterium (Candidatus Gribaldobacteria) CG10_big_fil_rev_8_21_14_0_10_37_21]